MAAASPFWPASAELESNSPPSMVCLSSAQKESFADPAPCCVLAVASSGFARGCLFLPTGKIPKKR